MIILSQKIAMLSKIWYSSIGTYHKLYSDNQNKSQAFFGIYTIGNSYESFGNHNGNTRIWHFDLLKMAYHQPQTSIVTLRQLWRVMLLRKNAIFSFQH